MGIVWLASYPKSGNTWVRFLLANYLAGPVETSFEVERLIPGVGSLQDANELIAERGILYSKTHDRWGPSHPFAGRTKRAVFITRHPKDVLLSNLNYARLCFPSGGGFSDEVFARAFITIGGDPRWIDKGYGSLEEHTDSWLGFGGAPLLKVRYEDLKRDTHNELGRILEFLELEPHPEKIERAVQLSTFERMRAMEVRERGSKQFSEVWVKRPMDPREPRFFMHQGKSVGSLKSISPKLDMMFDKRFARLMELLGYSQAAA